MKEIQLTQGKVALVDDADFDRVNQFKWCAHKKDSDIFYACRSIYLENGKRQTLYLHQFLTGSKRADHKDGDGLNNQRVNLRAATQAQNCFNRRKGKNCSSKFKGVSWHKKNNCWSVSIMLGGKSRFLGLYASDQLAALAYDSAALKAFGDFAKLNFPEYRHVLVGTRSYLIGYMEAKNGQGWRDKVIYELRHLGITFFSPYDKPFVIDIPETPEIHKQLVDWRRQGKFDKVAERMREIRVSDLRLVDISDWLIAYIDPSVATYGTIEELTTAVREKKPVFVIVEGGKAKVPLWLLGMLPPKYFYDSLDDVLVVIKQIDSGAIALSSSRWKLIKTELR